MVPFTSDAGNLDALQSKLLDVLENSRSRLLLLLSESLLASSYEFNNNLVEIIREHISTVQHIGAVLGRTLVNVLIGMVIGGDDCIASSSNSAALPATSSAIDKPFSPLETSV